MDVQLKKGLLDICVLKCLEQGESYGYKIISDLSPIISISESTLYPILKRLESTSLVTTRTQEFGGRLRKYYQITQTGKLRIVEFLDGTDEFRKIMLYLTEGV